MPRPYASKEASISSFDKDARTVEFIASTSAPDSDGDIVEQVWRLDRFKSNPVILFGHNSRALPIGVAVSVTTPKNQDTGKTELHIKVKFATEEANPEAEKVFKLIEQGILRAVSVGFIPHEVRMEKHDDVDIFVLSDNELLEVSVVPIPANQEALAKMKAKALSDAPLAAGNDPASGKEKRMEIEKQLEEANVAIKQLTAEKDALAQRCTDQEETIATYAEGAKELKARKDAELDAELEALVQVKIGPGEVAGLKALHAANPETYKSHLEVIKARDDLPQAKKDVLGNDPSPAATYGADANGDDFEKSVSAIQ